MMMRWLPLAGFALLAVLLGVGLMIADRKEEIPSPLIGQPMPDFVLPSLLEEGVVVTPGTLLGQPYVLNVWASWCVTCRVEHPVLADLAGRDLAPVIGLNYRDEAADARAWLARFGDVWDLHLQDLDGAVGIDLGVVAAPETFVIDADGVIRHKHIGGLDMDDLERDIVPLLESLTDRS
ncbi:MAG: DsbE family thiol:disulfide interchange protein [Xanthomonadales bacterium]|nr:DsbE family thiol:disulfide interchange protein [Xanthomonadales bacterium]